MQRKKRLMGKKGFVWADLVGAFQRAVGWFLDTVPPPIKTLLFLLFLLGFVSIFGFLLNSTGSFCDTNGNLYSSGAFSIKTNFELLSEMPNNDELGSESIAVDETIAGVFPKCLAYFTDPYYYNDTCLFCNSPKIYINNGSGFYYDGGFCTTCDELTLFNNLTGDKGTYCTGDVHRTDFEDKSWIQKQLCGKSAGGCEPPVNYYYDKDTNKYVCESGIDCENKTVGQIWNDLLKGSGAKITPASELSQRNYKNAVTVDCDVGDLNPKFKFFGVEVFNYKLWIGIYLLVFIIWAVYKLKLRS